MINILGIAKLLVTLEENRTRRFRHVMRMSEERLPKMALKIKLKGEKPVGRPRMRWEDQVKRDVERRGKPWQGRKAGKTKKNIGCYLKLEPTMWDTRQDE